MIVWGISANSHDAAIAVFDYKMRGLSPNLKLGLQWASHSERYSGKKNDAHLHPALISEAMTYGSPDNVVWYEKPLNKTLRQLWAGQGWNYNENNIKQYLGSYGIHAPISYVDHHRSHAAAGYYTSSFSDATVVCLDSIGEFETLSVWNAANAKMHRVLSQRYPHSIGLWYSAMTQRIGLKPNEDEYILMGMAAYGDPNRLFSVILQDFINASSDSPYIYLHHNLHKGCMWWRPDLNTEQDMFDIAAATQKVYEYILRRILIWASENTPSKNLVLMGGCALNCSANHIAYDHFENVWIMPNPGDSGSAIGAVLGKYNQHIEWKTPFLGHDIPGEYPVEELINELKTSGIAGVASGRAEFGPRAFGNRSLLADPRGDGIKGRVNDIKQRQQFRPFAPVVLDEYAERNIRRTLQ